MTLYMCEPGNSLHMSSCRGLSVCGTVGSYLVSLIGNAMHVQYYYSASVQIRSSITCSSSS